MFPGLKVTFNGKQTLTVDENAKNVNLSITVLDEKLAVKSLQIIRCLFGPLAIQNKVGQTSNSYMVIRAVTENEYEKIIDEYAEVLAKLGNDSAELKDEVSALLEQVEDLKKQTEDKSALIAKLTAKAIRPDLVTKVTFPSGKVKVTLSWDKDPDAAGYVLTVNGEKKEFKETADGFIYEDTAAEVGTTYKFEVVPYVTYNGETINGKTFKASAVPKVKLKKAVIKKLKAGNKSFKVKWKKVSGASGYKVSYKLGKKTKNKTVKGGKKVSLKVKKLTSGKTYTVKVRAWKKVNGKKYYGKWSKAKKVTVK